MIKIVICDGGGTLELPNPGAEMRGLITGLDELGIELAVATNTMSRNQVEKVFRQAGLQAPRFIATSQELGVQKPSPRFVYHIRDQSGVALSEIAYLGDDEVTDILCAINAGVLPFAALYANPDINYGVPVGDPNAFFRDYLTSFAGQSDPYFGWGFADKCSDTDTTIRVHALFGDHKAIKFTRHLTSVLKDGEDTWVGGTRVKTILYHYLLNAIFLSGLRSDTDLITVYPSHEQNKLNPLLETYSGDFAMLFKKRFLTDLLIRHTDAPKSQYQGRMRNIYDQFQTINVNAAHGDRLQGKSILVLDDFTTTGYSLETARRMLLQAGARDVVGLAIGKWGITYSITNIEKSWDPFQPCDLDRSDINVRVSNGQLTPTVDRYFSDKIWSVYVGNGG